MVKQQEKLIFVVNSMSESEVVAKVCEARAQSKSVELVFIVPSFPPHYHLIPGGTNIFLSIQKAAKEQLENLNQQLCLPKCQLHILNSRQARGFSVAMKRYNHKSRAFWLTRLVDALHRPFTRRVNV